VDTDTPGYGVPLSLILTLAAISGLFVFAVVRIGVQARYRPIVSGQKTLIGASGEVVDDAADAGWASVQGELWRVRSQQPLTKGQRVRVSAVDGSTLVVEPQPD
jgi:membrane-bound serine protease (ClpP class)